MRFSFITPTRIKYKNSLTKDLDFHILFRNLLRRISLLSYFHCGHRLDDQGFKDLIEQAQKVQTVKRALYWHDWERYSNRQKTRMKMGGFMVRLPEGATSIQKSRRLLEWLSIANRRYRAGHRTFKADSGLIYSRSSRCNPV